MSWDELVAAALIGTDRREVGVTVPPGAPTGLEAVLAGRGAEERLLGEAAAWAVARRAGALARPPVAVEPAPRDERPLSSPAARVRLLALLEEHEPDLIDEWLGLAARSGVRPSPELVPDLINVARMPNAVELSDVIAAAGPLAPWLAAREPDWATAAVAARDPDEVWTHGDTAERYTLLEHLRQADPDRARELVASTFAEETAEDRAMFLLAMAATLADADEPLLEVALDDRRVPVRRQAAAMLRRLPRSQFAARMAERARPLLAAQDGALCVTLPGEPDAAAQRDGIAPRGRRSERLTDLLAATPLSTWPLEWAALPVADELAPAARTGWVQAAWYQDDVAWAHALWPVTHDGHLLQVIPRAEAEGLAAAAEDPWEAAGHLRGHWGTELSRVILERLPRLRAAGVRVSQAGYWLDPELDVEPLRDLGDRDLNALCDIVATRAAMLTELA